MNVAEVLIKEDKQIISELIKNKHKFTLTLDEWSSNESHFYMNITLNLSNEISINLGQQ